MNKKFLIPLFVIGLISSVFAVGYVVNNFVIKSDVYEPFSVQYSVIGDASNWDGITGCDTEGLTWTPVPTDGLDVDMVGLYAGEGRAVCFKITNLAEADISYTISNEILNTNEEIHNKCLNAFGEHTLSGTAVKQVDTTEGVGIVVAQDAEPVDDCRIQIDIARG